MKYPKQLDSIFNKLNVYNIQPIIVGGYVRDQLLHRDSKDIDVELYGIDSLEKLEKILKEFGEVNSVGKSFGVCKLKFKGLEIDFSLPREDSKISSGHRGFSITTNSNLDFKTASSRRDFTINAIGFDVLKKELLDPFSGQEDIKKSLLKAVDLNKFGEDPLRVLRAVQFASRFQFQLDDALFKVCKKMVETELLEELPKERIFEEIKKLLLKSKTPSVGILLLKKLKSPLYFDAFYTMLDALDYLAQQEIKDKNLKLYLMLALLNYKLTQEQRDSFLNLLTDKKELRQEVERVVQHKDALSIKECDEYKLYKLAISVNIEKLLILLDAVTLGKEKEKIASLKEKAIKLHILHQKAKPLIQGKDLIKLGYKPSPKFTLLLDKIYDAQIRSEFKNNLEALAWIKINL